MSKINKKKFKKIQNLSKVMCKYPTTRVLHYTISLLSGGISRKACHKYSSCEWELLKMFRGSEVKGHSHVWML